MNKLYSLWLRFIIPIQRVFDHLWRNATGFPTLRRSQITPELYLGGQFRIRGVTLLKRLGITGIVSMRESDVLHKEMLTEFKMLHLPTPDQKAPTMENLQKGVNFIENEVKNNGKVYIHCKHGEGRGPTMAIAYLIHSGMTYEDAYQAVKKVRTFIRPTLDQIKRLKEFEQIYLTKKLQII